LQRVHWFASPSHKEWPQNGKLHSPEKIRDDALREEGDLQLQEATVEGSQPPHDWRKRFKMLKKSISVVGQNLLCEEKVNVQSI